MIKRFLEAHGLTPYLPRIAATALVFTAAVLLLRRPVKIITIFNDSLNNNSF